MSLINDALKRAKQAQQEVPPSAAPGPQLRPVEPTLQSGRTFARMLPIFIVAIIALGLFFAWGLFHGGSKTETKKMATTKESRGPTATLPSASIPVNSNKQKEPELSRSPIMTPPTNNVAPALLSETTRNPAKDQLTSNSVAFPTSGEPAPAPLKLQGILFDPAHPAAMIGGKMLFVNDKLGDWQVVAINRESATLSNAGQTNVLILSQ